jgi:hypothetical protein
MSGFVSSISNFATGVTAGITDLASIFGGSTTLTLGGITFESFEVPASIKFGNTQAIVLHKIPGGTRVIDLMGPDPDPISWSGIMLGANANSRAQALQAACDAGKVVTLSWATFSFDVVIGRFEGAVGWSRCDYTISCTIKPKSLAATAPGLQTGVLADIGGALSGAASAVSAITSAATATVGVATQALGTVSSFAGAFGVTIPGLSNIASDLSSVQSVAASASGLADGASTVGSLLSSATNIGGQVGTALASVGNALDFTGDASSIVTAAGQSGVMASLSQVQGLVSRAAINLGQAAAQPQSAAVVLGAQIAGAGTVSATAPTPSFTVL